MFCASVLQSVSKNPMESDSGPFIDIYDGHKTINNKKEPCIKCGTLSVSSQLGAAKVEASKDSQHVLQDKDANHENYDTTGMSGSASRTTTSIQTERK